MRYIIAILSLITCQHLSAQTALKKYLSEAGPSKLDTTIQLTAFDQQTAAIPMTIIRGAAKGPTFTIIAGIHGMEYPTIMSLVDMRGKIDPKKLSGNLVIIPIANTESFFQRMPFRNPKDGLNLNRVFPGSPNGSITALIADYMTNQVFPVTDILLDMHGGDVGEDLIPFICYYDNKAYQRQTDMAARLSEASGFEKIVVYPFHLAIDQPAQYAFKQAVRQGVSAFSIEIGKLGQLTEQEVAFTNASIFRILKELKMYAQETEDIKLQKTYYTRQSYISVPVQGFFYSKKKAGDVISKGEVLGHIKDIFGNELKKIVADQGGTILYKIGTPPVNVGETMFCIAQ